MDSAANRMTLLFLFFLIFSFGLPDNSKAGIHNLSGRKNLALQSVDLSIFEEYSGQRETPYKPIINCMIKKNCPPDKSIQTNLFKSLLKLTSKKVPVLPTYEILIVRNHDNLEEMNLIPPSPPPRF